MGKKTEHNEINEIFTKALDLVENERENYLDEACRNKPDLRKRVESLLKSFEDNEDFIENPIAEAAQILSVTEDKTIPLDYADQIAVINSQSVLLNPKLLRGDLDNIVLMALRKEPTRRYPSVEDLSKDISNYLNGLPVSARPNTFFYRASKFYQRNKTASIVGMFLALSLIGGIIATTWQSIVANRQRDRAEKRFQDVRQLSNSLLFEITPNIENLNGSTKAREILVKRALEYLDSLANESQNDLQLQSELASAYEKIGDLQGNQTKPNLNDFSGAVVSYDKAQSIRQTLPKSTENQRLLAENRRAVSNAKYALRDVNDSIIDSTIAIKIYENLVAENPDSLELQIAYIETQVEEGAIYSDNNQYAAAIPIFRKSLENIAKLDQNNHEIQRLKSKTHSQLANALSWNNQQPDAEAEMAKAVEIIESLLEKYPNEGKMLKAAFAIYSLASSIYEDTKNDVSLNFAEKEMRVANEAFIVDSADIQAKLNLGKAYSRLGICLVKVKQLPLAVSKLQKAENIYLELVNQEPKNRLYQRSLAVLYVRIGDAEKENSNFDNALKSFQKSADLFENTARLDEKYTLAKRDLAQSMKNIGELQLKLNRKAEAKQTFQKTLDILSNLKSQNALGEVDQKMIKEMQIALENL